MIRQFLQSLENPEMPLFAPNYWMLKNIALILPERPLYRWLSLVMHAVGVIFIISQYSELYVVRSELKLVLTNLKILMLSVVCIWKANTYIYWQNKWLEIIAYVTEADKFERESRDETRGRIIDKYTTYCRRVTYSYWILVFTTFVTTCGNPLLHYLTDASYREGLRNGTAVFHHIFSSWMPLDKYHYPGTYLTVAWHVLLCIYGASIMAAFDSSATVLMVFFGAKLELLRERCKQMLGTNDESVTDQEALEQVRQLHEIHLKNLKYMRMFNSVLSPVMLFYIVNCSLMLCASAYSLTTSTDAGEKILLAQYFVFGIAQLFVFCWHSDEVFIKNQNAMYGPFESKWWSASVQQKKYVLYLAGQLRIQHIFTAGPFTNLTLSTFIAIIKGAYSYYTLLRK